MAQAERPQVRISVLLDGKLIGFVRDITADGMFVSTTKEMQKGEHAEFGLSVPGALRAIPINGLVLDASPGDGVDVGFIDLDQVTLESLKVILGKFEEAAKAAEASGVKKKVLLVEDTAQIRNVYKSRLLLDGYDVIDVESATAAMTYLRDWLPDLVLLDLVMPVMDGFKLLGIIRQTPNMAELPVIILSAKGASSEIEKALGMGISGYLIKTTTSPAKLSQTVKDFFAGQN